MLGLHCCAQAPSSCGEWGLLSSYGAWASRCSGFSCCIAQALGTWASVVMSRGMWNLPGPGIKSMPPALAGRFFTTEPPGKPSYVFFVLCGYYTTKT